MTTEIVETTTMAASTKISPIAQDIAQDLLTIDAIQLNTKNLFTWVSGIKSPVYCDNRLINSDVKVRTHVIKAFIELIKDKFPDVEKITGIVTGGLPFGSIIADKLELPFIYVRQERKEHGLKKQIEGIYHPGDKVVVIEDHISTGKSSINAINVLKEEGLNILGLVSVMTYDFKIATELFDKEHITHYSLCNLDVILDVAVSNHKISMQDKDFILDFRNNF